MRSTILFLGTISAFISGLVSVFEGFVLLKVNPLLGLLFMTLVPCMSFSLCYVFSYVDKALNDLDETNPLNNAHRASATGNPRVSYPSSNPHGVSDVAGTPWENNPNADK